MAGLQDGLQDGWAAGRRGCSHGPQMAGLQKAREPVWRAACGGAAGWWSAVKEQVEGVEALSGLVDGYIEHGRDGTGVVAADGDDLAVEVLALHLNHAQKPDQHLERLAGQLADRKSVV